MLKSRYAALKKASPPSDVFSPFTFLKFQVILAGFLFFQPHNSFAQQFKGFDNRILMNLSAHRTEGTTEFMQFVSNNTHYISLGIPAALLLKGVLSKEKESIKSGLYMVKSLAVTTVITYAAKYTFNRKRPYEVNPFITKSGKGGSPSFPSGHTSEAFSTATSLSLSYPKWLVVIPAFAWAATIGYSRMYLGVHYPTDVFAGALVGRGSALMTNKINKWIQAKKKLKKFKDPNNYLGMRLTGTMNSNIVPLNPSN